MNEDHPLKVAQQCIKEELENPIINDEIKEDEANIIAVRDDNKRILDEINRIIVTKSMALYDKMKLGTVINIFNEKIKNGEIDEVFDIMIRMNEKRVMKILKKLDTEVSTILMDKMRKHKENIEESKKEK